MIWPAIDPGLATFYDRTIAYQADRNSPFSIWGQVPASSRCGSRSSPRSASARVALAFRPRSKTLTQVAAFGAALLIGVQLTAQHWFYLYIVWFYPLLLVAMAYGDGAGPSPARSSPPAPAGLTSTSAPITQTSSSAVSKRTGIWVISDCSACSGLTPSTLVREPVMPTSEMKAVPPGSTRASAVGTWVWVPKTAATRPSRCQPIATFSLVTSAWKSTIDAVGLDPLEDRVDLVERRARDLQPDARR